MRSDGLPLSIVHQNVASSTSQKQAVWRLCRLSAWQTPPNCRRFHDNLYQIHFSGCSALPESRRHSLPHPHSPLRATAFFRISRNRVQANNPHLNKSFGMNVVYLKSSTTFQWGCCCSFQIPDIFQIFFQIFDNILYYRRPHHSVRQTWEFQSLYIS